MKKSITIYLFIVALASSVPATSQIDQDAQLYLSKTFAANEIESVAGATVGGNIILTGTAEKDIRVNVYARSLNGKRDILSPAEIEQRINEYYSIIIEVVNRKLTASVRQKTKQSDWKSQLVIALEIELPAHLPVELDAPAGNITLKNLSGKAAISSGSGNFFLSQVNAEISGKTAGGNIYITNSGNDIYLQTDGGNIVAENCKGNLRLFTKGGMITLANLQGKIEARTTGGAIKGKNISGELVAYAKGQQLSLADINN